jgi:hypothetical protein
VKRKIIISIGIVVMFIAIATNTSATETSNEETKDDLRSETVWLWGRVKVLAENEEYWEIEAIRISGIRCWFYGIIPVRIYAGVAFTHEDGVLHWGKNVEGQTTIILNFIGDVGILICRDHIDYWLDDPW